MIVTPPVYAPFYAFVRHAGRRIVEVPLDGAGRLDLDGLDAAMAAAAGDGAFLLCSPHHPHGTDFVPFLSVPGTEDGFAVLSASKGWNLPGLKAAVAVAGERAATDLVGSRRWCRTGPATSAS